MARSDSQRPNRTCCRGRKVHSTPGSDARGICCAIPLSLRLYSSARSACRSRTVLPQQRCHCSPNACSAAGAMSPAGCHERRQGQQHPARHHVMPGMTEGISTSHVHLPISCPGVQQACLQHKLQQACGVHQRGPHEGKQCIAAVCKQIKHCQSPAPPWRLHRPAWLHCAQVPQPSGSSWTAAGPPHGPQCWPRQHPAVDSRQAVEVQHWACYWGLDVGRGCKTACFITA